MAESYLLKPSRGLARELNKVEDAAKALGAVMGEQNYLPSNFPERAFDAMLAGLAGISDASVDGADEVLRAAMRRLPSYTTEYLQDLEDVEGDELHGAWVRDGDIEQGFDKLTGLRGLCFGNSQVSDIGVLEKLTDLQWFELLNTKVTDWSPVAHVETVRGRLKIGLIYD